jgi:hypothetical protein
MKKRPDHEYFLAPDSWKNLLVGPQLESLNLSESAAQLASRRILELAMLNNARMHFHSPQAQADMGFTNPCSS